MNTSCYSHVGTKINLLFTTVTLLSVLASGAIAVPLAPSFPISELEYVVNHSEAEILIASDKNWAKAQELMRRNNSENLSSFKVEELFSDEKQGMQVRVGEAHTHGGIMLYTSGTTNKPVRVANVSKRKLIDLI